MDPVTDLGFRVFDADNHYYEAVDAFTRHVDPKLRTRGIRWATIDGKERLLAGDRIWRFIPNPKFDPVAKPGALDAYFRGKLDDVDDVRQLFGDLEPIRPEYRDRDARLSVMDRQGLDGCFLFPTLGVGVEEALWPDPPALYASLSAFNTWLHEDWGYQYRDRLLGAPLLSLVDPERAITELDTVIERGARLVCLRAGPIRTPNGGRSPGDPVYDPFWSRIEDAGIFVGYHSGDSGYHRYAEDWGESSEMEAFRQNPFKMIISADRPIFDTMAALVCHGVFDRHPRLRVATIESGSTWVPELLAKFKKAWGTGRHLFSEHPQETFQRHVWVSPFFEDDIRSLADRIGVDRVLMGSDWPHAEGLADPLDYLGDLAGFDDGEIRKVMRENARELAGITS